MLFCLRKCEVINMAMWNPWRGCHKYSEGCRYCYIHKGDFKRGIDTNNVVRTDNFYAPIAKIKSGAYKIKSGQTVYLCFSTDFLVEDADEWRSECWQMIREQCIARKVHFEFRQCGTRFIKDGKSYTLSTRDLCSQA